MKYKVFLPAFYEACGITPPKPENDADEEGVVEIKDGTDLANLCRRSGVPKDASVTITFPDVCFIPASPTNGGVPIPYPIAALDNMNEELRKGGYKKVKIKDVSKMSDFATSDGYEPGTLKGLVSSNNMGKANYTMASSKVKAEGKNVVTHLKMTQHNGANTPPSGMVAPAQTKIISFK